MANVQYLIRQSCISIMIYYDILYVQLSLRPSVLSFTRKSQAIKIFYYTMLFHVIWKTLSGSTTSPPMVSIATPMPAPKQNNIYLEVSTQVVFIIFECVSSIFPEPPLGISFVGVSQIFDRRKDWNWGSAMLISKILGVSTDTPDTLLTGPLFSITL